LSPKLPVQIEIPIFWQIFDQKVGFIFEFYQNVISFYNWPNKANFFAKFRNKTNLLLRKSGACSTKYLPHYPRIFICTGNLGPQNVLIFAKIKIFRQKFPKLGKN